jgi:hypothetical protein
MYGTYTYGWFWVIRSVKETLVVVLAWRLGRLELLAVRVVVVE